MTDAGKQVASAALALTASLASHAACFGLALAVSGEDCACKVAPTPPVIEITRAPEPAPEPPPSVPDEVEPEPPPPAPPKLPVPAPRPPDPEPEKTTPREAPPEPPADEPPEPAPVAGVSPESTAANGSGPAFAVGTTRHGVTPAVAPKPAARRPPSPNRAATRIPGLGGKHTPPKRKRAATPPYPPLLKSQGIEADVTITATIDARGRVTAVRVDRPARYAEFNDAARSAAFAERFEPATRDGAPVGTTLTFTYRFRLEER